MNLLKRTTPFYKILPNDITISKQLTQAELDKEDFDNTILDKKLNDSHGFIKLKPNMMLYNYFVAKQKIRSLKIVDVDPNYIKNRSNVYVTGDESYLKIPKGISKIFQLENGMKVLTKLQKAYNNILIENNTIRNKDENIIYQNLYTKLMIEFNNLICNKGGLYDRACNSLWPYSCRATITCNPNLKVNEISIPYSVLLNWVSETNLRKVFGIDESLSIKEAVKFLENKRVMVGRQPTHDRSNLLSFIIKLKFNNGYSIKINPAIVHLFDGDFDGDQAYVILPTHKYSQQDLINMDVYKFIRENPDHFRPGKEFKKYKPNSWNTNNYNSLNQQINNICKISTNGQSLSYHDCLDDGKSDGYFDGLNINKKELRIITNGISEIELCSNESEFGITNAIQSYKLIKQNVAQFGALTNAFIALAIYHTWDFELKDRTKFLDLVAEFKHILCQDGLSAKHGNNKLNADIGKLVQDAFYNTPDNKFTKKEEYINLLRSINLSEEIINTVMGLFWQDDRIEGINRILNNIIPSYRITRRATDLGMLENMTKIRDEKSIQAMMLF